MSGAPADALPQSSENEVCAMKLNIRGARPNEEADVASLWRACGLVAGAKDPISDFRFAKATASSEVLVGVDDAGQIRAAVMVGHDGHRGWLYYVAADPSARGQGFGREIVDGASDWLLEQGVDQARLLVLETNKKVVAFYEHLGFEVTPRVVMSKSLKRA
jgi:ribosomal protein S18 acetylase RimI-like enzyme